MTSKGILTLFVRRGANGTRDSQTQSRLIDFLGGSDTDGAQRPIHSTNNPTLHLEGIASDLSTRDAFVERVVTDVERLVKQQFVTMRWKVPAHLNGKDIAKQCQKKCKKIFHTEQVPNGPCYIRVELASGKPGSKI